VEPRAGAEGWGRGLGPRAGCSKGWIVGDEAAENRAIVPRKKNN
jgi:hypothetical protein